MPIAPVLFWPSCRILKHTTPVTIDMATMARRSNIVNLQSWSAGVKNVFVFSRMWHIIYSPCNYMYWRKKAFTSRSYVVMLTLKPFGKCVFRNIQCKSNALTMMLPDFFIFRKYFSGPVSSFVFYLNKLIKPNWNVLTIQYFESKISVRNSYVQHSKSFLVEV